MTETMSSPSSMQAMAGRPDGGPDMVAVETGALRGVVEGDVLAFKGVPYAAAPVGELRWRPPQPAAPWAGVRAASAYANDAMQLPFPTDAAPLGTEPAEDCLYLNVWRPADTSRTKLPVMVWIHGGGFVNGGSSPAVYAGDAFARQGIVFVSFNYRLGRFGFFAFPALTAERPGEPKGNYGYMDQIAALKWVQRNIAAFGGDPAAVTVFGESAGGGSVHMLLTAPAGRGLFARAAIQSAGARDGERGPRPLSADRPGMPSAETIGVNFARRCGIEGVGAEALASLRALSAEAVTDGLNMATARPAEGPLTYGGPILDGRIVVETPQSAYQAGRQAGVPLLIGANTADIGFSTARTLEEVIEPLGDKAAVLAAYDPEGSGKLGAIRSRVAMDRSMIEPSRFVARAFAAAGAPVYHFRFGYVADSMRAEWRFGAPHATEIPYVLDTVEAKYGADLTARDAAVAGLANRYWANFAKTGDPNGPGLPPWPRYDAQSDTIMLFGADGGADHTPDPWRARLDLTAAAAERASAQAAEPLTEPAMPDQSFAASLPPPPDTLSAEARAHMAALLAAGVTQTIDVPQMRAFTEQIQALIGAEQRKVHDVTVADDVIAGVPVRRIAPSGAFDRSRVLINIHGGGFATDSGSLTENIPIAALSGLEVVAVLYRFAPEHPFPAAVDDTLAVYRALLAEHDPRDIGVYGTSAGAVIGPQLMMRLKAEGLPLPGVLGVFSGESDLVGTADSLRLFATAAEEAALNGAKEAYVGGADPHDPLVSPIYGDLSGFPPTLCLASGRDILLSGTVNLSRALTDAGVAAELVVYDALPHAFWSVMLAPESDDAFRRMASFLTRRLGRR